MGSKEMFLITTSSSHSPLNLTRAALDQLFKVSDFKNCSPKGYRVHIPTSTVQTYLPNTENSSFEYSKMMEDSLRKYTKKMRI